MRVGMFLLQPHLIEKSALTKKPTLVRGGKGGVFLLAGRALAGSLQNTSKDSRPPRRCPTLTAVVPWEVPPLRMPCTQPMLRNPPHCGIETQVRS